MTTERPRRVLDSEALKGLAHPLRVQLLDTLTAYGPATASGLAEQLGESSGATSYHLRQLERHGFVREVAGRGSGRERWWERMPGAIELRTSAVSPSAKAAAGLVERQWAHFRAEVLADWVARGATELPEWRDVSGGSTISLRLTVAELAELTAAWEAFATEVITPLMGRSEPGSRPVQVHFNAFPLVDGEPTPPGEEP